MVSQLINVAGKKGAKYVDVMIPEQLSPSPMYPGTQSQVKLPGVLVQSAFELQPPLSTAHSFTSVSQRPLYIITLQLSINLSLH